MKGSLSQGYLQMWKGKNYHMREELQPSKVRIVEDMKYVGLVLRHGNSEELKPMNL